MRRNHRECRTLAASPQRGRRTAPAHGLVLHRVNFPPEKGPFAGAAAEVDLEEENEECQAQGEASTNP